ncbi:Ni/Fe-hydrogenase, b-type cytochrome subunit [Robiginitalea aurantiaca]|uniref:Ni/Fe-hydrogenase, b-type cytochrome subunit n=1 Tax=Robiginitalea aurantiaca TaxID=3056915 RepID=A0ABT7WB61_9FLAO|nr:Ni/Fe-hydrogenase, b-type cytochrome subunit [Robiginitalea aurantiaca]MDM9630152.1 Ni/Fe-hydrogenase, b-type cytochrome subunit [Robiginitalea aurantiaca]
MRSKNYKRVYVWELPVRIFHWINVLCITVLATTGFIIADPPAILSGAEASESYWFGTVRFIHFATAYIFFFNMLLRIYWAFVGNRFANWKAFLPFSRKMRKNILHVLKIDILLMHDKTNDVRNISVGHNSVAALSYVALFIVAVVQVITGFGLYADNSGWWLPDLFSWVVPLFGGDFMVRTIHHVATWFFILFTLIHVYLVFYHDWLEGRGEVSSMFGGYKFVQEDRLTTEDIEDLNENSEEMESTPAETSPSS